jgi:hypothetical protein
MSDDALVLLREQTPERIVRFCEALLSDASLDLGAAAVVAGAPGQGRALLEDRRTLVLLGAMRGELRETHRTLRHQLVGLLAQMSTFDPADAFGPDGATVKSIHEMPPEVRMALDSVSTRPDGTVQIKFSKRLDALKLLFTLFGDIDTPQAALGTARVVFHGRAREI